MVYNVVSFENDINGCDKAGCDEARYITVFRAMFSAIRQLANVVRGINSNLVVKAETSKADIEVLASHFLNDYGDSMLRMAYSYVHNYADSEDIVQDAVMKVLEKNPVFENSSHEKAYLLTAVSNLAKNKIRYNKLRETDELSEELIGEEREDLSFVWEAVKGLSDIHRTVIHLFYYEGYSTLEIARILERKDATVRSDLNRARQALREVLKEEFDFE